MALKSAQETQLRKANFTSYEIVIYAFFFTISDFPIQFFIYTSCRIHHVFWAWGACVYDKVAATTRNKIHVEHSRILNVNKLRTQVFCKQILSSRDLLQEAQAPQAQNTWCMRQLTYIENCMGKSPIVKKIV